MSVKSESKKRWNFFTRTTVRIVLSSIAAVSIVGFVAAGVLLSQGKELGEHHVAFLYDNEFSFQTSTFDDYINYSLKLIQAARVDSPSQQVILNVAPFELKPGSNCERDAAGKYAKGIVLIHGLFETPYSMRALAEHFQLQCFYVLAIALPDHATRPGNLLTTHWEDWADLTHFAVQQLASKANTVFIAGHSAGATLALLEAERNSDVEALILFAPALAITPAARFAQTVALIGKVFPKAAWLAVEPDATSYRYESYPFTAVAETYSLIQATQDALNSSTRQVPVFTVASMQDNTVQPQAILDYMATNTNPHSHTLLYSQHSHQATGKITVINSNGPQLGVSSVSHLGLMIPPTDPIFGREGDYKNCSHYGDAENPLYVKCKNGKRDYYGETTAENLKIGVIERIAFNPYYDAMLVSIGAFIDKIGQN